MNIEKNELVKKLLKFEDSQLTISVRSQDLQNDMQFGWHTSKYKIKKDDLYRGKLTLLKSGNGFSILRLEISEILNVNVHSEFEIIVFTITYRDQEERNKIIEIKVNGEKVRKEIEDEIKEKRAAATTRFLKHNVNN